MMGCQKTCDNATTITKEAFSITAEELVLLGKEALPEELISNKHLIYLSLIHI